MDMDEEIKRLARQFADNRAQGAGGTNVAMARGGIYGQVWSYMHHWFDDHGVLPSGEHVVAANTFYSKNGRRPSLTSTTPTRVDFTQLRKDPEYPKNGRDHTYVAPEDEPPPYVWDSRRQMYVAPARNPLMKRSLSY